DAEPVSLHDVGAALAPVAAPPAWSSRDRPKWSEAPPAPIKNDKDNKGKKPVPRFFQVDSVPPPGIDVTVEDDTPPPPRNSGHEALRILTAKAKERAPRRSDTDLFLLRSGLFADAPRAPGLPADLVELIPEAAHEGKPKPPPPRPVAVAKPPAAPPP